MFSLIRQQCPGAGGGKLRAFSLVEVVLSLGIVAFVLVALLGLLSVGMGALKDSGNDTLTGMIFHDVRERMMEQDLVVTAQPMLFFYDRNGTILDQQKPTDISRNYYRVEVSLKTPKTPPDKTPPGVILSAVVNISWPAAAVSNGTAPAGAQGSNQASASFLVASDSTASWKALDGSFNPKIAF